MSDGSGSEGSDLGELVNRVFCHNSGRYCGPKSVEGLEGFLDELLVAETDSCKEHLFTVKLQLLEGQKKGASVPW